MRFRGSLALLISWGIGIAAMSGGSCAIAVETTGIGAGGAVTTFVSTGTSFTTVASGGAGGSFGDAGPGAGVAAPCQQNSDCAPELLCLPDTVNDPIFGGGPAGGFCTQACNADADCPQPGAVCLQVDPGQSGRCTLACDLGPPITMVSDLFAPLDPAKCRGREDLRCAMSVGGGGGVCLPTCGEDAQCDGGRFCDPHLAVCVDKPSTGLPTGAACDPSSMTDPCGGLCVGFSSGVAMCSSPCVLGGEELQTDDCGGPEHGFCAFHAKGHGPGDTGYCSPSCQAQSDCQTPSFWCFSVPTLSDQVQRGYCFAATPCPGGQNDCTSSDNGGYVCTDTASGPFCLDAAFPAGSTGAGGAGGGTSSSGTGGAGASSSSSSGGTGGAGTSSSSGTGGAPVDGGAPADGGTSDGGAP